ncbi:MAG: ATP-binding cassette domain-containing protein, partial [Clostridia bacterium]|nr:ATP-binding cassette domain-containing protein [Clostridia bacterium]
MILTDVISCKNITVHNERTLALDDVSFDVKCGEFLTIVGENGAGKSTLARVILGILTPDSGEVTVSDTVRGK